MLGAEKNRKTIMKKTLIDKSDAPQKVQDIVDASFPIDQVKEALSKSGFDTEGEPDEDAILREEKDLGDLKKEKPTDLLEDPKMAVN